VKKIIVVAVTFAAVAGLSSVATAEFTDRTINACVNPKTKALQVSDCKTTWDRVDWNRQGIQGEQGPAGLDGASGDDVSVYYRTAIVPEGKSEASASCDDVRDSVISGGFGATKTRIEYSFPRRWDDGEGSPPDRWEIRWRQGEPGPVHVTAVCMSGLDQG
jgi:hypothetical protein